MSFFDQPHRSFAEFTLSEMQRQRSFADMNMTVPKAPWIAVAPATAFPTGSRAAASQSQSKALRAFSCKVISRKLMGSALRMTAHGLWVTAHERFEQFVGADC